jgi:Flp pilus assembly CpaF family ATPase
MADFERIVTAYENALDQMTDDLVAGLRPSAEERDHLILLAALVRSLVKGYGAHHLTRSATLDATTSVMYATSHGTEQMLNVPLRSLVDYNSVTAWQARFLNGVLGMRRTVIVTGPGKAGKSSLANALVQLIPVDQRIVAVEGDEELPTLRQRSFTVHLSAQPGTASFGQAVRKAAGMHPTWIVAGPLTPPDLTPFLGGLAEGISGIATMEAVDAEVTITELTTVDEELAPEIARTAPFFVHMERDDVGRPRIMRLLEAGSEGSRVRLQERRQT